MNALHFNKALGCGSIFAHYSLNTPVWFWMSESSVKCFQLCAPLTTAWHSLDKCERDPGLFASHIKVRDATGNERGDRERAWHSDRADSNTHVLSASQQEHERVSHVFRVKMRHRLPKENAQGQRDWWGLTQSEAERWFCALTLFQTPSKIGLNVFLHHGKQDFSCSSQVKESVQTNSNVNNSPSTGLPQQTLKLNWKKQLI